MTEFLTHSQCLFTKFRRLFLNVEDRYYSTHDLTILQFYDFTIWTARHQRSSDACVAQRSKNVQCSILKSPWSSSGRGNIVVREPVEKFDQLLLRRIRKTIQEQGGIVVEPFYADK